MSQVGEAKFLACRKAAIFSGLEAWSESAYAGFTNWKICEKANESSKCVAFCRHVPA
jgi:hypothetical protein